MAAEDTVKKFVDAINRHDVNAIMGVWAQDAQVVDPSLPQPLKGKEAVRQNMEGWLKAFPDVQFKTTTVLSKGDTVVLEIQMGGTQKGPFVGPAGSIPATNKRIDLRGVGIWRLNPQGLIAEERRYYDTAGIMRQLGLMPKA